MEQYPALYIAECIVLNVILLVITHLVLAASRGVSIQDDVHLHSNLEK